MGAKFAVGRMWGWSFGESQQSSGLFAGPGQKLLVAAENGEYAEVQRLLAQGVDVNYTDGTRETALSKASRRGHTGVVQLMLKGSADPKASDKYGSTPLHEAAQGGHPAIVKLLLDAGADTQVKNKNGETAVMVAQAEQQYHSSDEAAALKLLEEWDPSKRALSLVGKIKQNFANMSASRTDKKALKNVFHSLDVNRDGSLQFEEFVQGMILFDPSSAPQLHANPELARPFFAEVDQDGNGAVDFAEFSMAAQNLRAQGVASEFEDMDENVSSWPTSVRRSLAEVSTSFNSSFKKT